MTSILEAILPELQKIVALENKTSGSNITCATIDVGYQSSRLGQLRIRIQNNKPDLAHKTSWLDIGQHQIFYHYYIKKDDLLNIQLHSKQLDWTDPDILDQLTQHIKTIASTGSGTTK